MLDLEANNSAASRGRADRAKDCKIVRLGAAAGKHDLPRLGAGDRRDLRARSLEHPARALAAEMHRRGIPARIGYHARNGGGSLDAKRSARVMIEIDRHERLCSPPVRQLAYRTLIGGKRLGSSA